MGRASRRGPRHTVAIPRVSVIIAARNAEPLIATAVRSVVSQSYEDWELIVADDASEDQTASVASTACDRATVVRSDVNLRASGARNLALREATGELVAFLDADDWWLPTYLEEQVARYDAERSRPGAPVALVACDARLASADGELLDETYLGQFRRVVEPVTLERLLRRNVVFISALVPRSIGESVGWFDEELTAAEDYGLWLKLVERGGRVVVNRTPLAVYRRTDASVSHDLVRQAENNLRVLRAALARNALDRRQRRVAHQEIRYNRALEAVSRWRAGGARGSLARALPNALFVAFTRPCNWPDWYRELRA